MLYLFSNVNDGHPTQDCSAIIMARLTENIEAFDSLYGGIYITMFILLGVQLLYFVVRLIMRCVSKRSQKQAKVTNEKQTTDSKKQQDADKTGISLVGNDENNASKVKIADKVKATSKDQDLAALDSKPAAKSQPGDKSN